MYSGGQHNPPQAIPLMHHINDGGVRLIFGDKKGLLYFIKVLRDDNFLTNLNFLKLKRVSDEK